MPEYQKPQAIERGVERLIEPYKTYRIQKDGKTTLLKIKEVGSTTLTVQDMATHKTSKMNKATFQNDLNNGRIYVSSKVTAGVGEFTIDLLTSQETGNEKNQMSTTHVYTLDELKQALLDPEPENPRINFYDDDMDYSTDELMRDLKKDLPTGYTVSRSGGKVKVKRAFTGPAKQEDPKRRMNPDKEEFDRLVKENQKGSKPRLKVLQALAKVVRS